MILTRREAYLAAKSASHSESDWVFVLQKQSNNNFEVSTRRRLCVFGNEYKIITKFQHGREV